MTQWSEKKKLSKGFFRGRISSKVLDLLYFTICKNVLTLRKSYEVNHFVRLYVAIKCWEEMEILLLVEWLSSGQIKSSIFYVKPKEFGKWSEFSGCRWDLKGSVLILQCIADCWSKSYIILIPKPVKKFLNDKKLWML